MAKYISILEAMHLEAEVLQNKYNHLTVYVFLVMQDGEKFRQKYSYLLLKNNNKKSILSNNHMNK